MPTLPLPNLDDRRWEDLVDEGRSLIPFYAPEWTDHNVHDPGISLLELFAWVTEQDLYTVNRVTDAHRRKLLALAGGVAPDPPRPAGTMLGFGLAPGAPAPRRPPGRGPRPVRRGGQLPHPARADRAAGADRGRARRTPGGAGGPHAGVAARRAGPAVRRGPAPRRRVPPRLRAAGAVARRDGARARLRPGRRRRARADHSRGGRARRGLRPAALGGHDRPGTVDPADVRRRAGR